MFQLPGRAETRMPQNSPILLIKPMAYPNAHQTRPEHSPLPARTLTARYPETHANRPQHSLLELFFRRNPSLSAP